MTIYEEAQIIAMKEQRLGVVPLTLSVEFKSSRSERKSNLDLKSRGSRVLGMLA